MIHVSQVIRWMEEWAPPYLAMPKDPIGLKIGRMDRSVGRIMVTLDVLDQVVDEAIAKKVDLIITHHPLIYHPLREIRVDTTVGKMIGKLLQHDIAVYAAHTNFDAAEGGMNDIMADRLKLIDRQILVPVYTQELRKVVVYVPESHVDQVFSAMTSAGAGWIGNYSHCTFQTKGTGTFLPREGANPFLGHVGEIEKVSEVRIESIVPKEKLEGVLSAMLSAHPYEEVAYDVYPLEQKGKKYGYGRIGRLEEPLTLYQLAEWVREKFALEGLRFIGEKDRIIRKVAIMGGAGRDFIRNASALGADVYITGDIGYHDAHDALERGLAIIDGGHTMEKVMKEAVAAYLEKKISETEDKVSIVVSETRTDPFSFL